MQRAAISAIERPAIFDDQDARDSAKKSSRQCLPEIPAARI
jgi:hypothetical protein